MINKWLSDYILRSREKIFRYGAVKEVILESFLIKHFPEKDTWWRQHQGEYCGFNPVTKEWRPPRPQFDHFKPDLTHILEERLSIGYERLQEHLKSEIDRMFREFRSSENISLESICFPEQIAGDIETSWLRGVEKETGKYFRGYSDPAWGYYVQLEFRPLPDNFWEGLLEEDTYSLDPQSFSGNQSLPL